MSLLSGRRAGEREAIQVWTDPKFQVGKSKRETGRMRAKREGTLLEERNGGDLTKNKGG